MADLSEPIFLLAECERAAEFGLFVFELRLHVSAEFSDDVVLPAERQVLFYGLEITVKKFHGVFLA
jgi:hypothetical protein